MRSHRFVHTSVTLLLVGTFAATSRADATPDQIAAARALGRAGVAEMEAGDCAAAVAKLSRAEVLYHAPTTAEPLGECQIAMGKIVAGTETLTKLVHETLAAAAPPAFVAAQARARDALARAAPKIAKLRLHVSAPASAGQPVVTIDGEPVNAALLDNDRPTDPGAHDIRATAPGCVGVDKSITLGEGESRAVALNLGAVAGPPEVTGSSSSPQTMQAAAAVSAEPDAPSRAVGGIGVRTHDGFYFRAGLGVALFAGGSVAPPGSTTNVSVSGAGPSLELAIGGTPWRGLVIGGGIYGMTAPGPTYSASGASLSGGAAVVSSIGPFADWYVDPEGGWHIQGVIGLAAIQAGKGTPTEIGGSSYTFPSDDESGTGISLLAGVGYEWWVGDQVSLGAIARIQYVGGSVKGSGDTDSTSVKLVVPAILGTLTYQ
jgi:hypothetical protein